MLRNYHTHHLQYIYNALKIAIFRGRRRALKSLLIHTFNSYVDYWNSQTHVW